MMMMMIEEQIIAKVDEISNELNELVCLLKQKPRSGMQEFEIVHNGENYDVIVSQANAILLKLKRGLERKYALPFPKLPNTSHWEMANEFLKYFQKIQKVKQIFSETPPGFRSKQRADLFIETVDGKWYWVEVQTTLQSEEIERKISDAASISDDERYAEYILVFEREFEKESLFMTTMMNAKSNVKTNKLRIMLYSDGSFETVLEPEQRM